MVVDQCERKIPSAAEAAMILRHLRRG